MWGIEYDNNDEEDGGFSEWWVISDGEKKFIAYSEKEAVWLKSVLEAKR